MTEYRKLTLAWFEALDLWDLHRAKAEAFPDDRLMKIQEEKSWEEVEELHRLLLEEERRIGI